MALIPNLNGTVIYSGPIGEEDKQLAVNQEYFQHKVILRNVSCTYPKRELEGDQVVLLTMNDFNEYLKIGSQISFYAFEMQRDNYWQAEGEPW